MKTEVWCESCGCLMKFRKGKYGNFWGCTAYPHCKSTLSLKQALDQLSLAKPKVLRMCEVCGKKPAEWMIPECKSCAELNGDYSNPDEADYFHPGHPRFYGDN